MGDSTKFDPAKVTDTGTAIGDIMHGDRMTTVNKLLNQWPNAGMFPTAQVLERTVDDRRNAIVEHANRLNIIFNDMSTHLHQVATNLKNQDTENGKAITHDQQVQAVTDGVSNLSSDVNNDVKTMDINTEAAQHNFSQGSGDMTAGGPGSQNAQINANDGDGWDDDLTNHDVPTQTFQGSNSDTFDDDDDDPPDNPPVEE